MGRPGRTTALISTKAPNLAKTGLRRSHTTPSAEIASSWEKTVGNVIRVDASTNAVTQTVYPLWVQFE